MGTSKYDEDKQITWEDFLGNEEKELELLIHIDSSRQARGWWQILNARRQDSKMPRNDTPSPF